jgi:membrane protein
MDATQKRGFVDLLRATWRGCNDDKVTRLASSIAYATLFSIAPLFIVLIAVAGWAIGVAGSGQGHRVFEYSLLDPIRRAGGPAAADTIRQLVAASFNKPRESIVAQVAGWIAFVAGASALFAALQDALNTVWQIEATKAGWAGMLRDRVASLGMLVVVAFVLIVSFALNGAVAGLTTRFAAALPFAGAAVVLPLATWLVSLAMITAVLAMIYKILPDVGLAWRDVWAGAFVSAILFVIGQAGISWYIAVAGVGSAYGAAGSILVILIWIYYSAITLLVGAEFTNVLARTAATTVPAAIRLTTDRPAGTDPRRAGGGRET